MWSGDRPFYSGEREGKKEKERGRETKTHADGHVDRWTDRHSKLGCGLMCLMCTEKL